MCPGPEADVWSCGVVLFKLLSTDLPFKGETTAQVFENLRHGEADFSCLAWRGSSALARDLLRRMLTKDPAKRITAQVKKFYREKLYGEVLYRGEASIVPKKKKKKKKTVGCCASI